MNHTRLVTDPRGRRATIAVHARRRNIAPSTLKNRARKWGWKASATWANHYVGLMKHYGRIADMDGVIRSVRAHAEHHDIPYSRLCSRGRKYGWRDQRTWHKGKLSTIPRWLSEVDTHEFEQCEVDAGELLADIALSYGYTSKQVFRGERKKDKITSNVSSKCKGGHFHRLEVVGTR